MKSGPKALAPKALARRLGGIVVMLLALGPAVIVAAPSAQAYTSADRGTYEAWLTNLINATRARSGLVRLAPTYCPLWFSSHWAHHLADTGTFYHQSMYPILRTCRATVAAENLARGNVSPVDIMAAWMASPGHRANILDRRLTRIGVTAIYARGTWTIATDFARY
jgi:uncharacterized protein YkwD